MEKGSTQGRARGPGPSAKGSTRRASASSGIVQAKGSSAPSDSSQAGRKGSATEQARPISHQPEITPQDPIAEARGQSVVLRSVVDWIWPGSGRNYVSANVRSTCVGAYARALWRQSRQSASGSMVLVEAADLMAAAIFVGRINQRSWGKGLDLELEKHGLDPALVFPEDALWAWANDRAAARLIDGVLRWDAVAILERASQLRQRTNRRHESIGLRHVYFAALMTADGQRALQELGLLGSGLAPLVSVITTHLNRIPPSKYFDDPAGWIPVLKEVQNQPLLIDAPTRPRSGFSSDAVQPASEDDEARAPADPLGVQDDAVALADLILLEAARPPLAISLFGSWGSGKTTLMSRLKSEIVRQTREERGRREQGGGESADTDPQTRRVANVAQLDFNAWSFADSENLWASLTAEIFDQLRRGDAVPDGHGERLLVEVAQKLAQEEERSQAFRPETVAIEKKLGKLENEAQEKRDAAEAAPLTAAAALAGADENKLDRRLQTALSSEQGKRSFKEQQSRPARAVWLLRHMYPRPLLWAAGAALALFVAGLIYNLGGAGGGLVAWIATVAAPIGAAGLLVGRPLWEALRSAAQYEHLVAEKRAKLAAEEERIQAEICARQAELDRMRAEQASHDATVAGLAETKHSPARLLQYLLRDSADIQQIKGQVGLMATVRRCFETLNDLIAMQRTPDNPLPLDRIVLYIDDLDRCSADVVVKVLEAVHLLLAFECFVVVVAIDARWLRLSLERSHPQFQDGDAGTDAFDQGRPSPSDYLEKIFQVPFWVRPLTRPDDPAVGAETAYCRYLDELLGARVALNESQDAPIVEEDTSGGPSRHFIVVEPARPQEQPRTRAERVRITDAERDVLDALEPLAAKSPRAVKRLVNIYRLLRTAVPREEEPAFLSSGSERVPSFAAVLLALAVDASLPAAKVPRIWAALTALSDESWERIVAHPSRLGPTSAPDGDPAATLGNLLHECGCLYAFRRAILAVQTVRGGLDRSDLIRAARMTQRYSFRAP